MPSEPRSAGNPVYSIYGFDMIYYGTNLADYLRREFLFGKSEPIHGVRSKMAPIAISQAKRVPFWSQLIEEGWGLD